MKIKLISSIYISTLFMSTLLLSACATYTPSDASSTATSAPSILDQWLAGKYTPSTTLTSSSRIQQGVLENGMQYYIVPNQTPKNEVVIRMRVGVGSMYESPKDAGIAHFLEHMAFNGSSNVPEGEMIAILERYGLQFGADTNASTGFEETIYKLDLPNNDAATIDTALFLLRETASNLTIADSAVQAEIPVVTAEYEARNNIYMEAYKASMQNWTKGLTYIDRFPIGTLASINGLTADAVKAFYAQHYYPANTQLIIAGDVHAPEILAKINATFADWDKANLDTGFIAGNLEVNEQVQVASFTGANIPTQVNLYYVTAQTKQADTVLTRRSEYVEQIANDILAYRLNSLVLAGQAPFQGVSSSHSFTFEQIDVTQVVAQTEPEQWASSLETLVVEIRRMLAFGITEQELQRSISAMRNRLVTAAQSESTIPSGAIANAVLSHINTHAILNDASQSLALFEEWVATFHVGEINQLLIDQFERVPPTIFIQFAEQDKALPSNEQIMAVYNDAFDITVTETQAAETKAFAYTDFGASGQVIAQQYDELNEVHTFRFANGVQVNFKASQRVKEQVLVNLAYGKGGRSLTPEQAGLSDLYRFYVVGGLAQHSVNELRELLSDKNVSLNFGTSFTGFGGTFNTSSDTLSTQLQLLVAYMTDAGYNPEVLPLFRNNIKQSAQQRKNTIGAVKRYEVVNAIYGNDYRVGPAPTEAILQRDFTQLKPVLIDALTNGPITLSIVGDIDIDDLIEQVAATFGTLPVNVSAPEHQWVDDIRLQTNNAFTLYHEGNPENASVTRYYKTTDNQNLQTALHLRVLGAVVQLKVQDVIREKLGAAYSPSARAFGSNDIVDDGMLLLDTLTTPDKVTLIQATYDDIIAGIKTPNYITDDEVKRAIEPMLANWQSAQEKNGFWLARLKSAHTKPDTFARYAQQPSIYAAITATELTALAQQFLIKENQIEVLVLPTAK